MLETGREVDSLMHTADGREMLDKIEAAEKVLNHDGRSTFRYQ